ncbi:hypothetical protein [Oscillatoria sp. FACHB-1406]|uniref:hypothetical protein n=1 Tax=Oscillatoria sp. FACHB-1406 TaxID=2692846 RepID=UPI00168475A3|nr:hypothetical protein [Oscillatoria sp. FACHB-1406]MBD2579488.1 hypothetical protein [Oscillatoria sp. FACHB-1406]
MVSTLLDRIGEWNPQLFRELKGRLKPRNLGLAAGISLLGQLLVFLFYQAQLPALYEETHRLCIGNPPPDWKGYVGGANPPNNFCLRDAAKVILPDSLNWQLWWLDLFTGLSIIAIFALLVGGVYLLIADLSNEERRGTFGFIRLSPRSTFSVLSGKILGVPALLYVFVGLMLPLNFYAAIAAKVSLPLVFGFYGILAAACIFFYSASLLYGLVSAGLGSFQAWLGSGLVLGFLWAMTLFFLSQGNSPSYTPLDWVLPFSPTNALNYVVSTAPHSLDKIGYGNVKNFAQLTWFDWRIFDRAATAYSFMFANFALWTYWAWQGLQRRYPNPNATVFSKSNSYWLSGSLIVATMGFALQQREWGEYERHLFDNFGVLLIFVLVLCLGLMAALSPQRPTLYDWARYRHQNPQYRRSLLKDLVWGEKSPATVAIALNLALMSILLFLGILLLPFKEFRLPALFGVLLTASMVLIYATIAQKVLMMKAQKRGIWATAVVGSAIVLPLICSLFLRLEPTRSFWLLSAFPTWAAEQATATTIFLTLLGQWTAITLANLQMSKQLRHAGESQTKVLLQDKTSNYVLN